MPAFRSSSPPPSSTTTAETAPVFVPRQLPTKDRQIIGNGISNCFKEREIKINPAALTNGSVIGSYDIRQTHLHPRDQYVDTVRTVKNNNKYFSVGKHRNRHRRGHTSVAPSAGHASSSSIVVPVEQIPVSVEVHPQPTPAAGTARADIGGSYGRNQSKMTVYSIFGGKKTVKDISHHQNHKVNGMVSSGYATSVANGAANSTNSGTSSISYRELEPIAEEANKQTSISIEDTDPLAENRRPSNCSVSFRTIDSEIVQVDDTSQSADNVQKHNQQQPIVANKRRKSSLSSLADSLFKVRNCIE